MNQSASQLEYPPLSEVRKNLRVKWYRCPIEHQRLRELSTRDDRKAWRQAGGHVGLYLLLAVLTVVLWANESWILFGLSLWFVGFVATFFKGTAAHELGHGTVFKSKFLNQAFLHLVCAISWWDPYDYGASHTYHHRFTTHPIADRENVLPLTPSLHPVTLFPLLTLNLFAAPSRNFNKGGFIWNVYLTGRTAMGIPFGHIHIPSQEWLKALHEDQPIAFRQSVLWSRFLLMFHGAVLALAVMTGWWVLPLVISMPSFIANIGSYLLGTTQHCGLMQNSTDFRKNTRSITLPSFLEFLYWRMNWCYHLESLAKAIESDMPKPRTLVEAWREMRVTWREQQTTPGYEFDTEVPSPSIEVDDSELDSMIESIGDLAPKGSKIS